MFWRYWEIHSKPQAIFFRTLLDWLFALQKQSFPSFVDFLDSCNFCIWFVDPLYTPCALGCSFFILIKLITYPKKKKKKNLLNSLYLLFLFVITSYLQLQLHNAFGDGILGLTKKPHNVFSLKSTIRFWTALQIVQLTASGNFDEALALCKLLPPEDASHRTAKEGSIHIRWIFSIK